MSESRKNERKAQRECLAHLGIMLTLFSRHDVSLLVTQRLLIQSLNKK